jgi:hypothetical protein
MLSASAVGGAEATDAGSAAAGRRVGSMDGVVAVKPEGAGAMPVPAGFVASRAASAMRGAAADDNGLLRADGLAEGNSSGAEAKAFCRVALDEDGRDSVGAGGG